jgi:citrate synthase
MADEHTTAPGGDRRQHARGSGGAWKTAITHIEQNRILIRGYHVDEMMARVSFPEAIYLL